MELDLFRWRFVHWQFMLTRPSNYTAGNIGGSVSGVKIAFLGNGSYAFTVTGNSNPDGSIYNSEEAITSQTTGRLYGAIFVRHWDSYITPQRQTIFYGSLKKDGSQYALSKVVNVLKGTNLESPVPQFGSTDNFDVSSSGIAFVSKDPVLQPAIFTKINAYFVPLTDFTVASPPSPIQIQTSGFNGQATSPVFSPDGKQLAFLRRKSVQYESDKLQLFVLTDVAEPNSTINALPTADQKGAWDRSPSSVFWSPDGKTLYLTAEEHGRVALFTLEPPSVTANSSSLPKKVFYDGAISSAYPLSNGDVFISGSNLVDNSIYFHYDSTSGKSNVLSSNAKNGTVFGLSRSQISEIWYPGAAEGTQIHAWVFKPSNFSATQKYPLAYLIHGGPQGSWEDSWSTRWNPAVFAEQGYVVVAPNPTGSTGYGQGLTDAIQGEWGGLPYEDIVLGFQYIEENLDYVDTSRAVELGASYGGKQVHFRADPHNIANYGNCRLHDQLDPGPRSWPQVQGSCHSRWRLQHGQPTCLGRAVVPRS